jgi:hypothetical protein
VYLQQCSLAPDGIPFENLELPSCFSADQNLTQLPVLVKSSIEVHLGFVISHYLSIKSLLSLHVV